MDELYRPTIQAVGSRSCTCKTTCRNALKKKDVTALLECPLGGWVAGWTKENANAMFFFEAGSTSLMHSTVGEVLHLNHHNDSSTDKGEGRHLEGRS